MANLTRHRLGEYVLAVFGLLDRSDDGVPAKKIIDALPKVMNLHEWDLSPYPNQPGVIRYTKTVRFATIKAVKAGWMVKDGGRWILTPEGRQAMKAHPDPMGLQTEMDRLYQRWRKASSDEGERHETRTRSNRRTGSQDSDVVDQSVEIRGQLEEAEETARQEIARQMESMNAYEFQDLVAGLLRAMGYHISWIAPPGRDDGVDIHAYTDPLGANGPRILVQVRHRDKPTIAQDLRAFLSKIGDKDVGLYVSLAGFTSDAEREARGQEKRRIILWSGQVVQELWATHYMSLHEDDRQRLPLKAVYFLAPRE